MPGLDTSRLRTSAGTVIAVAAGAIAGANLRFLAIGALTDAQGILLANVVGSFLLGLFVYWGGDDLVDRHTRLLVTTGFISSLTTYSGFAIVTATGGDPLFTVAYVAGTYALALTGVILGRALAIRLRGEPA